MTTHVNDALAQLSGEYYALRNRDGAWYYGALAFDSDFRLRLFRTREKAVAYRSLMDLVSVAEIVPLSINVSVTAHRQDKTT